MKLTLCVGGSDLHERVDFVACLGGDGVILHASNLFRGPVPPVVSFNLGSLGFLTSHSVCLPLRSISPFFQSPLSWRFF